MVLFKTTTWGSSWGFPFCNCAFVDVPVCYMYFENNLEFHPIDKKSAVSVIYVPLSLGCIYIIQRNQGRERAVT